MPCKRSECGSKANYDRDFLRDLRQPEYIHVLVTSFRDSRSLVRARDFGQLRTLELRNSVFRCWEYNLPWVCRELTSAMERQWLPARARSALPKFCSRSFLIACALSRLFCAGCLALRSSSQ